MIYIVFAVLIFFLSKKYFFDKWFIFSFSLITAGFFSNLYDKIVYNGVIDYLYLPFIVFNLADVYIIAGFIGIIRGLTKHGI